MPAARRDDSRRASVAICRIISDFPSVSGTQETIERMRAADNPFSRNVRPSFADARGPGPDDGLGAAGHPQLGEDAGDVVAGRVRGRAEPARDRGVGQPAGDQARHLPLPGVSSGHADAMWAYPLVGVPSCGSWPAW